jgi:hypothetical protein
MVAGLWRMQQGCDSQIPDQREAILSSRQNGIDGCPSRTPFPLQLIAFVVLPPEEPVYTCLNNTLSYHTCLNRCKSVAD